MHLQEYITIRLCCPYIIISRSFLLEFYPIPSRTNSIIYLLVRYIISQFLWCYHIPFGPARFSSLDLHNSYIINLVPLTSKCYYHYSPTTIYAPQKREGMQNKAQSSRVQLSKMLIKLLCMTWENENGPKRHNIKMRMGLSSFEFNFCLVSSSAFFNLKNCRLTWETRLDDAFHSQCGLAHSSGVEVPAPTKFWTN